MPCEHRFSSKPAGASWLVRPSRNSHVHHGGARVPGGRGRVPAPGWPGSARSARLLRPSGSPGPAPGKPTQVQRPVLQHRPTRSARRSPSPASWDRPAAAPGSAARTRRPQTPQVLRRPVAGQSRPHRVPRDPHRPGDRLDRHSLRPVQPADLRPVLHREHPLPRLTPPSQEIPEGSDFNPGKGSASQGPAVSGRRARGSTVAVASVVRRAVP